jgi:hypothetical protein
MEEMNTDNNNKDADQVKKDDDQVKKDDGSPKSKDDKDENAVTSNSPVKQRVPAEHEKIDAQQDKRKTPSTSGEKGTEEPGSDKGPGGTGW